MARREARPPAFDLEQCRHLVLERPVVEVSEDDVTEAFKTLAHSCPQLQDKGDFNALAGLLGFEDALGLRREVRAQLERQREDAVAKILRLRVLRGLLAYFDHEPDAEAVRLEVASLVRDAEELGQHLTPHKIETLIKPLAAKRVVGAMLVKSLAKALEVDPSEEQILAAFDRQAALYRDPQAVREKLRESTTAAKPVIDELVENLVVEAVMQRARVTNRPMSLHQLAEELERAAMDLVP